MGHAQKTEIIKKTLDPSWASLVLSYFEIGKDGTVQFEVRLPNPTVHSLTVTAWRLHASMAFTVQWQALCNGRRCAIAGTVR